MLIGDIRTQSDDELGDEIISLKKEAFNVRFQQASGQLENTSRMRQVRRDIAKVNTVINERRRDATTSS